MWSCLKNLGNAGQNDTSASPGFTISYLSGHLGSKNTPLASGSSNLSSCWEARLKWVRQVGCENPLRYGRLRKLRLRCVTILPKQVMFYKDSFYASTPRYCTVHTEALHRLYLRISLYTVLPREDCVKRITMRGELPLATGCVGAWKDLDSQYSQQLKVPNACVWGRIWFFLFGDWSYFVAVVMLM